MLLEQARVAAEVHRVRIVQALDRQSITELRRIASAADYAVAGLMRRETMLQGSRDRLAWFAAGAGTAATARTSDEAIGRAAAALSQRLRSRSVPDRLDDPAPLHVAWRGLGVELLPVGGWITAAPSRSSCGSLSRTAASM